MSRTLRLCMVFLAFVSLSTLGYSQAYVITPSAADAGNPGGVNTNADFVTTGGTSIWSGPQTTLTWSASQAIPFTFNFYGSPVTHYIVTGNGLISFDTTNAGQAAVAGLSTNVALPSADLPDKTICMFWEDFTGVTSSSDDVYATLHGSSPNQQLWIHNYSMKIGACSFFYSGVVLEEGTDKIYIVDMNYGSGTMTATCGVQIDGTTSYQVTGSPNIQYGSGGSSNTDNEYWEFAYYGAGACIPPVNVSTSNLAATSVDINYDLGTASSGQIEYGTAGFSQGSGTTSTITGTSTTLSSLSAATNYEFYVRSDCSGTFSNWAGPYSFVTTCATISSFPYSEDFDNSNWVALYTYDQCWSETSASFFNWRVCNPSTFTTTGTGPLTDASGSGSYLFTEASSSGGDAFITMPELDLTSLTVPELEFKFHMYGANIGKLYVEASLDTGLTWTTLDSIVGQQQGSDAEAWGLHTTDLSTVSSAYTLVRYRGVRGAGTLGDISIDEVVVHETPPCPTPTGFLATYVGSTTADVTFNAASGSVRSIEWGPQGFTPGTGGTASSTTDTVNITGLPAGTCLDVYIMADCSGAGNGVSAVAGPFTICTAYIPDWLENFDNGYPPSDFLEAQGVFNGGPIAYGASNWIQDNYGNASGGSNAARFNIYSTFQPNHWMVTPAIDLGTGNTYNFEYDVAWTEYANTSNAIVGSDDTVHVVISTDNGQTWDRSNILMSYHQGNVVTAAGQHEVIQLFGYSGTVRFGFFETSTVSNEDTDFFIDNIEVRTPPACLEPYAFSTINIMPDSVYFTFLADTSASSFNIEWGPCGFTQGTGMTGTISNDSAGIGGLMAATCYEVYIQTDCGSGQSIWSGPFQFNSACDTLPIPWNEGFEGMTAVGNGTLPACWAYSTSNVFYLGTANGTSGANPGPRGGGNYLFHRYSFNNEWWSFTPEFHLQAGQSYEFSFWYQTEGTGVFDEVKAAFGTGQTPADMIYTIKSETGVSSAGYTQFSATFIPVTTGNYNIGVMTRTGGFSGVMDMDDFQLQLDPNPCPNVSSLVATIISANEVDLAWGGTSSHTNFDVEWGATGFTVGTGQGHMYYGLTTNTLNLDTISENTCYDFYVRGICGTDTGGWVGPYTWCTPCTSSPMPYLEDFDVWPLNCVDPAAGQQSWVNNGGWAEASFWSYNDIDLIMDMRNVDVTVDARVKFTWSHLYNTFYPEDGLTVRARVLGTTTWDTLWSASGAALNSNDGAGSTTKGTGVNEIIVLDPATYTGHEVEFQLFAHSDFGPDLFVNDFKVEAVPTCPEPFSINYLAGSVTTTSGTVYYAPGGASNFNLSYAPIGTITNPSAGTIVNATNDTATLTGLMPSTTYEVWVRDSCGAGDVSFWTGPTTFTTLCVPFTTPYIQDFNNWAPNCWDLDLGTYPWSQYGGQWAEASYWSYNNVPIVMESPLVILSDSSEMSFKWSHLYSSFYPDDAMTVRVKAASGGTWDTLWTRTGAAFDSQDGAGNTTPGSGVQEFLTIPGFGSGDTIVVQFYGFSDFGPDAFIDDVNIYDRPGCNAPANFTWLSSGTNSGTFTWDAGSAGSTSWVLEVGAPGFQPGSGTSTMVMNDTATVSGLMASSNYCVYLTEICPGGLDSSSTIGPLCFQTACAPVGIPYSEDFTSSSLSSCFTNYNTANNISTNAFWRMTSANWMGYGAAGKSDHTGNGGYAIGVDASSPYDATMDSVLLLTPYIDITGNSNLELSFWVFSDASAYTYPNNVLYVSALTPTGWINIHTYDNDSSDWEEIVIPLAGLGLSDTTQFMFGLDKAASAYFYDDLVIDDILVDISTSCFGPSNVAKVDSACTSIEIDWTSTKPTSFVEYGATGYTPGSGSWMNAAAPYVITGLMPGTAYDVYVADTCNGDTLYTGPFAVTTETGPLPTLNATAMMDSVTLTTAYWSFDAGSTNADSVYWDFGGVSQSGEIIQQTFGTNQSETVTVTAYNDCGMVTSTVNFDVQGISVEESVLAHTLSVFPNPTSGVVTVDFRLETDEEVTLTVINALGQRVVVEDLGKLRSYSGQVDLSALPRGIYILQVNTGANAVNQRITLQ